MPPATGTQQAEAAPAAAPAESPPMFSSMGIIVLIVIMAVEAVAVFFVAGLFGGGSAEQLKTPEVGENYSEVLLGEGYHRQFQDLDATNFVVEHFRLKVGFVLNPNYDDLESLQEDVESRKKQIQSRTWDVIDSKTEVQLRQRTALETLKLEIKSAVNEMLGATDDGQEIVYEVIFPDRSLLQPRK